jgi:hypothetical protein
VFENRVLRKIFGRTLKGTARNWKEMDKQKIHDLYFHKILFGAGHVARMTSWGNLREDHFEDLCLNARILLKWIFKKYNGVSWIGYGSGYGQVIGCYIYSNEPPNSMRRIS